MIPQVSSPTQHEDQTTDDGPIHIMAAFPRLPEELIVEILSRLPRSDLENVACP